MTFFLALCTCVRGQSKGLTSYLRPSRCDIADASSYKPLALVPFLVTQVNARTNPCRQWMLPIIRAIEKTVFDKYNKL